MAKEPIQEELFEQPPQEEIPDWAQQSFQRSIDQLNKKSEEHAKQNPPNPDWADQRLRDEGKIPPHRPYPPERQEEMNARSQILMETYLNAVFLQESKMQEHK